MAGTLHLAQAQSNRGPRGRKQDFLDAERLVKRLAAHELTLSFVPEGEQRLWRTVMRRKYQLTRSRVQLQNRLECLLEEAHLKLSSLVSDLLGASARRMLHALATGATDPVAVAALGSRRLRATPEQLADALGACRDLHPVYRQLVRMTLEELRVIEDQITELDQQMAELIRRHQDAVERLAAVPGLGVDSAQQIIAEVGPTAATFPTAKQLASWVGACPGEEESAGVSHSHRSPKGNRHMRRLLYVAANAAAEDQRESVPAGLSTAGHAPRARASHRGDCASAVPADLEDPARRCAVRRTRSRGEPRAHAATGGEDDPGTAKPWLSGRPDTLSAGQSIMSRSVVRPWFEELKEPRAHPIAHVPAHPAPPSAPTASPPRSAKAAWGKCIGHETPSLTGTWR